MEITLIGRIENKNLTFHENFTILNFRLFCQGLNGQEVPVDCVAWRDNANKLDRILTNNCMAKVFFAQQRATPHSMACKRAIDAMVLHRPVPSIQVPIEKSKPTPVAWGLWREGHGWYSGLKKLNTKVKKRNTSNLIAFNERNTRGKQYVNFQDCLDEQRVLKAAFGCTTIIKPILLK